MPRKNKDLVANNILDAVIWCKYQAKGGYIQITQVAARAGISSRTLNRYFPDKSRLFGLAAAKFVQIKYAEFEEHYKSVNMVGKNGLCRLLTFLRYMKDFLGGDIADARQLADANFSFMGGMIDDEYWKVSFGGRIRATLAVDIREGIKDGSIKSEANPDETAALICATYNGVMQKLLISALSGVSDEEKAESQKVCDNYFKELESLLSPRA